MVKKLFGYKKREWFGKDIESFLIRGRLNIAGVKNLNQYIRKTSKNPIEVSVRCKDGDERILSVRLKYVT